MYYKRLIIDGQEYPIAVNETGNGAPNINGVAGMIYRDSSNGKLYICTGGYNWTELNHSVFGAAPDGYGLGGSSVLCSDVDAAVDNGFYYTTAASVNKPFDTVGWFVVSNRVNTDCVVQTYYIYEGNSVSILVRKKNYSKVWGEWEWVNPPMTIGQEYRTTERWNGKPVYTKPIDFGALPNNTTKDVWFTMNASVVIVSINGVARETLSDGAVMEYNINGMEGVKSVVALQLNNAIRITTSANLSNIKVTLVVKYTK